MAVLLPNLGDFWAAFLVSIAFLIGGIALAAALARTASWLRRRPPHGHHTRPRTA